MTYRSTVYMLRDILSHLKNNNDLRFSHISRKARLGFDRTIQVIEHLKELGFVEITEKRDPSGSGRKKLQPYLVCNITGEGIASLAQLESVLEKFNASNL
jgi:predicted transcriptional regulator